MKTKPIAHDISKFSRLVVMSDRIYGVRLLRRLKAKTEGDRATLAKGYKLPPAEQFVLLTAKGLNAKQVRAELAALTGQPSDA